MTPEDEPTASRAVADRRIAEFDSDDLGDDEQRAQLHAAILAAEQECDDGQPLDEAEFWAKFRKAQ